MLAVINVSVSINNKRSFSSGPCRYKSVTFGLILPSGQMSLAHKTLHQPKAQATYFQSRNFVTKFQQWVEILTSVALKQQPLLSSSSSSLSSLPLPKLLILFSKAFHACCLFPFFGTFSAEKQETKVESVAQPSFLPNAENGAETFVPKEFSICANFSC